MNSFVTVNTNLKDLANILNCQFTGNPDTGIKFIGDINNLLDGRNKDTVNFESNCIYYVSSEKILNGVKKPNDNCVALGNKSVAEHFKNTIITGDQPRLNFMNLLEFFNKNIITDFNQEIMVHPSAKIAGNTTIAPGVYIGQGVEIEEYCVIYPNVVIEPFVKIARNSVVFSGVFIGRHSVIGQDCIINPNAVIGSDGFGFFDEGGKRYKIPQIGNVVLGNHVEIGACTTIDRSTLESTVIGDFTKIDNLVQIAHNCIIGKNVYIAGKASLAGSVKVRDNAILAGGCGIRDHVCIAEGSIILAFTGVEEDTEPHQTYFGIPARKARDMHRINSALTHLPELVKKSKKSLN